MFFWNIRGKCYIIRRMENVLFVGKEGKDAAVFMRVFKDEGKKVILIGEEDEDALNWNKGSSIGAKTLILQGEMKVGGRIEGTVFFHDSKMYLSRYPEANKSDVRRMMDEMFFGFQYLTFELLERALQKDNKLSLIYVVKSYPSLIDGVLDKSLKVEGPLLHPVLAAAEAAFASFAENIAAENADSHSVKVYLVTVEEKSKEAEDDGILGEWLLSFLKEEGEKSAEKNAKDECRWIKAGGKAKRFSLFG